MVSGLFFVICLFVVPGAVCDDFLSNWMGSLMPVIGNLSLLDISLPGTHDSMTFDLSTTVSDGTFRLYQDSLTIYRGQ